MSRRARLVILAVGVVFFAILLAQAGLQGLIDTLRRAGWVLAPIVGVWGLVYVSNTIAWIQLIEASAGRGRGANDTRIPFVRAYLITVASFAINYATPFVALGGEPFRIASAAQWIGPDRAAASVISFRVTHTLGQVIFWLLAIPVAWVLLPPTAPARIGVCITALVLLVAATLLVGLFRRGFVVRALDTLHRLPLLRRLAPRLERSRTTLQHVDRELEALTVAHRPRLVLAVIAEVVGRSIAMLEFLLIARAEGLPIGYATAFLIGAFSQLTIIALVFIPFELGSREGGLYVIYHLLRLPPALGVYAGVVSRLRELIWIAVGLTFVWVAGRRRETPA